MSAKRRGSFPTSADQDLTPEINEEWIKSADLYQGKQLVRRGRPKVANPRKLLSLRLQPDVIARWKATGPGWQTRMAQVLAKSAPKSRRSVG